jgi:predicted Zn-dependent protease
MACAKPVISTLSGSIPEVVGDAGILVQPNDHLSLYRAIKRLIVDEELGDQIGKKAFGRAEKHFDSQKTAKKITEIFRKVLNMKENDKSLKATYLKGVAFWKEGRCEDALTSVCDVFNKDPDNKKILGSLVEMAVETNQLELAENALRRHLLLHPANLDALYELSKILLSLGKYDESEEELNKIFIFDPEREDAKILREQIAKDKPQLQES